MMLNMKKEDFLTDPDNKQHFLEMLAKKMNDSKLKAIHASGDADVLIIQLLKLHKIFQLS